MAITSTRTRASPRSRNGGAGSVPRWQGGFGLPFTGSLVPYPRHFHLACLAISSAMPSIRPLTFPRQSRLSFCPAFERSSAEMGGSWSGMGLLIPTPRAPPIVRAEQVPVGAIDLAAGAPGWGVLALDAPVKLAYDGPAHRLLRADVFAILRATCPALVAIKPRALAVDDRFGVGIAESAGELLESCIRLVGLRGFAFGDLRVELAATGSRSDWLRGRPGRESWPRGRGDGI